MRNIVGRLLTADGLPSVGTTITFALVDVTGKPTTSFIASSGNRVFGVHTVTTNGLGDFKIALVENTTLVDVTNYYVKTDVYGDVPFKAVLISGTSDLPWLEFKLNGALLTSVELNYMQIQIDLAKAEYWKAEASRKTADSYATEPENVHVKVYTSNGDDTYTITNTTEYSALHWATKAIIDNAAFQDSLLEYGAYKVVDCTASNQANPLIPRTIAYYQLHSPASYLYIDGVCRFGSIFTVTSNLYCTANSRFKDFQLTMSGNKIVANSFYLFDIVPIFKNFKSKIDVAWVWDNVNLRSASLPISVMLKLIEGGADVFYGGGDLPLDTRISIKQNGINFIDTDIVAVANGSTYLDEFGVLQTRNYTTGGVRVYGEIAEELDSILISQNIEVGDTVIHIRSVDIGRFQAGMFARVRGENDITGEAIQYEDISIVSVDAVNFTITVALPMEYSYLVVYPDSEQPVDNDWTTISISKAALISAPIMKDTSIVSLPSDKLYMFEKDSMAMVVSNKLIQNCTTSTIVNTSQVYAFATTIMDIDLANNTVTMALPAPCDFTHDYNLRLLAMNPIQNSTIQRCTLRYEADNNKAVDAGFKLARAMNCTIKDCHVDGRGGQKGHAIQIREGVNLTAIDTSCYRPKFGDNGEGYGATMYACTESTIIRHRSTGTRHALLFFKNACYNKCFDITAIDSSISAIDFHGANSNRNLIDGVVTISGNLASQPSGFTTILDPLAYLKSHIKFGNPTHIAGDNENTVRNVTAFSTVNPSAQGVEEIGIHLECNSNNNIVENATFNNMFTGVILKATSTVADEVIGKLILKSVTFNGIRGYIVSSIMDLNNEIEMINCIFKDVQKSFYLSKSTTGDVSVKNLTLTDCIFDAPKELYEPLIRQKSGGTVKIIRGTFNGSRLAKSDTVNNTELYLDNCTYNDFYYQYKFSKENTGLFTIQEVVAPAMTTIL
jgi:hypothetical protein